MDLPELLTSKGIEFVKGNNPSEIQMKCTNPNHEDSSPSLSFNLDKNIFNCWSCGFRGGATKFLASIGETEIISLESKQPHKINKLKDKLSSMRGLEAISIPEDAHMFAQPYRAISEKTYKEFRAFTTQEMFLIDYLCFPIYQFGKLRFIEGRAIKNLEKESKYSRKPGSAKIADVMFPLDKLQNTYHVILVEGLFDMLNLWDLGYENVLCLFGAHSFNKEKLNILDNFGITKVTLILDPDKAGQSAAEKIEKFLDTRNIICDNVILPQGKDPGNLTIEQAIRYIK